jgi:hypothetical protein
MTFPRQSDKKPTTSLWRRGLNSETIFSPPRQSPIRFDLDDDCTQSGPKKAIGPDRAAALPGDDVINFKCDM